MVFLAAADMPAREWYEAIKIRRSRRTYDGVPLDARIIESLSGFCASFRPVEGPRLVLLPHAAPEIFLGIGSYGSVRNAPSAVVFVAPAMGDHVAEAVGYMSAALLLEATRLGLDTCWVGGAFRPRTTGRAAGLKAGERVWGVTPIGHAAATVSGMERVVFGMKQGVPKPRKALEEIAPELDAHAPAWVREGIAAARLAPSAYNRQPWRFRYVNGRVRVALDGADTPKITKRIDCGIAMQHFEVAARVADAPGRWELLDSGPDLGVYCVE